MKIFKRKILLFLSLLSIISAIIIRWLSLSLTPVIVKYGVYESENIVVKMVNGILDEMLTTEVENEIINYNEDIISLNFNVSTLNSIYITMINKLQFYLHKLEKGNYDDPFFEKIGVTKKNNLLESGLVYSVPVSRTFNNSLLSNLGGEITVRYRIAGNINGAIMSEIKEYGINNAMVEIYIKINSKMQIMAPMFSEETAIQIKAPLVMKILQGNIPESFYGSQVIGGGEQ